MISASDELEKFLDRSSKLFSDALLAIAASKVKLPGILDLADLIQHTMMLADLNGRKRVFMEEDKIKRWAIKFADVEDSTPIVPNVPFEEAIEDMVRREPRLASSAAEVSRLYNSEKVFAMAKSVNLELTKRAQKAIEDLIAGGKTADAENIIMEIGDWTRAYSATVYRTNAATAYSNGRMVQVRDSNVILALKYAAQMDERTRPNHAAAHGFIGAKDDDFWKKMLPPNGFSCRCAAIAVGKCELQRLGLIDDNGRVMRRIPPNFSAAHPDPGFNTGIRF